MINPFILKKYLALGLGALITGILTEVALISYGIWYALAFMFVGVIISIVVGNMLLKNPFSVMLEGKGILAFDMTSTGIIKPFIVKIAPPYVSGNLRGKEIRDIFDRKAVHTLTAPKKSKGKAEYTEDGGLNLNNCLSEDNLNASRFGFFHYPLLIYNSQLKTFITKDWFSEKEMSVFAEHSILYANRKIEDLNSHLRDFARHIVETLRPKGNIFASPWVKWILIIAGIILLALLVPAVIKTISHAGGGVGNAVENIVGGTSTIMPK
jgi:hypothetical protein